MSFKGNVTIFSSNGTTQKEPKIRHRFYEGDFLKTGANSTAKLLLDDGITIVVAPNSEFTFKKDGEVKILNGNFLRLIKGKVRIFLRRIGKEEKEFKVLTPNALCAVRGTDFIVLISNTRRTDVYVNRGIVEVKGISEGRKKYSVMLEAGKMTTVYDEGIVAPPSVPNEREFRRFFEDVDISRPDSIGEDLETKEISWNKWEEILSKKDLSDGLDEELFLYGPSKKMLLPGLIEMLSLKKKSQRKQKAPLPPPHPDLR